MIVHKFVTEFQETGPQMGDPMRVFMVMQFNATIFDLVIGESVGLKQVTDGLFAFLAVHVINRNSDHRLICCGTGLIRTHASHHARARVFELGC